MSDSLQPSDIAYIAGLFDGEGSVYEVNGNAPHAAISVTNKHMPTLLTLQELLGGHVYAAGWSGDCWVWRLANKGMVVVVLQLLLPCLVIKHSQAALAIQLNKLPAVRNLHGKEYADAEDLRGWCLSKLKELKHRDRGYTLPTSN